jgi:DNA-binding response OmpR family regulator
MIRDNGVDSETLLYVGRTGSRTDSVFQTLKKHFTVITATSGRDALQQLCSLTPAVIVIDAASMRTPGERICRTICAAHPRAQILHILPADADITPDADIVLKQPLTSRRLLNNLRGLLKQHADDVLNVGPFSMNVSRRVLIAYGQETQLNPKLAMLIELFLRHPNTTIDRETLMKKVWKTSYLGDTRTLDVHIRWAREALENKGAHPRCLVTVRGVGYRLDIDPESSPTTAD